MAYIVSKQSNKHGVNRKLYYVVRSYRDSGKVRRQTIAKLGESKTVKEAIENIIKAETESKKRIEEYKDNLINPKPIFQPTWRYLKNVKVYMQEEETKLNQLIQWQRKIEEVRHEYKM